MFLKLSGRKEAKSSKLFIIVHRHLNRGTYANHTTTRLFVYTTLVTPYHRILQINHNEQWDEIQHEGNSHRTQTVKTTDSHSTTPTPTPTRYTVSEQADVTSAPNTVKEPTSLLFGGKFVRQYWERGEIMFHRGTVTTNPRPIISNSSSKGHFCHYISSGHGLITWRKG